MLEGSAVSRTDCPKYSRLTMACFAAIFFRDGDLRHPVRHLLTTVTSSLSQIVAFNLVIRGDNESLSCRNDLLQLLR
jgi:hypothetical protein